MQSVEPDPNNPWPHRMVLSIDQPDVPLQLLFARHVRHLEVPEVPPIEWDERLPDVQRSELREPGRTVARWRHDWAAWWSRYLPQRTGGPDAETERLLRELDDDGLVAHFSAAPSDWLSSEETVAFARWRDSVRARVDLPLERHPERIGLHALVPAWRSGLTTVIELPYAGDVADRISPECLVVSRRTRWEPALYARALAKMPMG